MVTGALLVFGIPILCIGAHWIGVVSVTLHVRLVGFQHVKEDGISSVTIMDERGESCSGDLDRDGNAKVRCKLRAGGWRNIVFYDVKLFVNDVTVAVYGKRSSQSGSLVIERAEGTFKIRGISNGDVEAWGRVEPQLGAGSMVP